MAKSTTDWAKHLEGFERSGLKRAEYCRRHGLSESSMSYQIAKSRPASSGSAAGRFVAVTSTAAPLEVIIGKAVVRVPPGSDVSELRRVVEALSC